MTDPDAAATPADRAAGTSVPQASASPTSVAPAPVPGRPVPGAASPLSDGEWHRLHPMTPLFRGGLFLVVIIGIVIANLRERLVEWFLPGLFVDVPPGAVPPDPVDYVLRNNLLVVALLVVLGVAVILVVLFYVSWRFHTFRITGDHVEVRSGVLFRTQRRAPLDRVQGVNLTRPMVARLLGMAKLEVVGAGSDGNVKLEYLSTVNAEAVRADILTLASGAQLARSGRSAPPRGSRVSAAASAVSEGINGLIVGAEHPVAEPASVVHIPVGRLVASHLLSGTTLTLLLMIAAIVVGSILGTPWVLFAVVPTVLGFGAYWVRGITRALRYSIAPTPDGVRITFGLFTTVTEILPPGRVHAVEVTQSLLWRPAGWWTITVNRLSGRNNTDTTQDQFTTVLPVGTRGDAERVLRLLMPGMPESEWPVVFADGLLGPRDGDPYTTTPRRARLLRLLSWRRNGFLLSPDAVFLRRGIVWRKLAIFPLARAQSIALHQGPLARALGVASARVHTVMGRVSGALGAIDREAALVLFARAEAAAVAAAASDRTHRWAGAPGSPEERP
ncbi:PH domain-containing protein [Microbacterium sp. CJ88]|uniref:PH domain-containing protein n=1 Tax=Microbacterium sp. CJ88 TaxID=3445672 RepID=UPI003F65D10F